MRPSKRRAVIFALVFFIVALTEGVLLYLSSQELEALKAGQINQRAEISRLSNQLASESEEAYQVQTQLHAVIGQMTQEEAALVEQKKELEKELEKIQPVEGEDWLESELDVIASLPDFENPTNLGLGEDSVNALIHTKCTEKYLLFDLGDIRIAIPGVDVEPDNDSAILVRGDGAISLSGSFTGGYLSYGYQHGIGNGKFGWTEPEAGSFTFTVSKGELILQGRTFPILGDPVTILLDQKGEMVKVSE